MFMFIPLLHILQLLIRAFQKNDIAYTKVSNWIIFQLCDALYFLLDSQKYSALERKQIADFMINYFSWKRTKNPYENEAQDLIRKFFCDNYLKRKIDIFFRDISENSFFEKRIRDYRELYDLLYYDFNFLEESYLNSCDLTKFFKQFKNFSELDDFEKTLIDDILITLEEFKEFDSLFLLEKSINMDELDISPKFITPDSFKTLYLNLDSISTFLFKNLKSECIIFNKQNNRFELIGVIPLEKRSEGIVWENLIAEKNDFYIIANTHFSLNELRGDDRK